MAATAATAASATLRAPVVLRSLAARPAARLRPAAAAGLSSALRHQQQRRWAQVHDVRLQDVRHLATSQIQRNVAEKYREKLDRKAHAEGLPDVDALKTAYADKIAEVRREDEVSVPGLDALLADEQPPAQQQPRQQKDSTAPETSPDAPPESSAPSSSPSPSAAKGTGTGAVVKPLSEILDLPKARALPEKELAAIWRLRHAASPTSLCAAVPAAAYTEMAATAARCPTFVLPVPRAEAGAEIHLLQWVFDAASQTATVLFTQLAEYKARGEFAQPHTSVTHYWDADLARAPGVVLMNGAVVEGRGVAAADAQWLVMLLQRFYGPEAAHGAAEKRRLVHQFARGDPTFSLEKLLEESEKLA